MMLYCYFSGKWPRKLAALLVVLCTAVVSRVAFSMHASFSQPMLLPCRSLSLADLLDIETRHSHQDSGSPRVLSNAAIAAAEAATLSALHQDRISNPFTPPSVPDASAFDTELSSDAASDSLLGLGARLPRGFNMTQSRGYSAHEEQEGEHGSLHQSDDEQVRF